LHRVTRHNRLAHKLAVPLALARLRPEIADIEAAAVLAAVGGSCLTDLMIRRMHYTVRRSARVNDGEILPDCHPRSAIILLVLAMARAGLRPLGQAFVQF